MTSHRIDAMTAVLLPSLILCNTACSKPAGHAEPSSARQSATPSPARTTEGGSTRSDETTKAESPYDLQFIDTMTRHHRDAIEAGKLASTRARHPELRECAGKLATGHERQVTLLTEWRDKWYVGYSSAENSHLRGMTRLDRNSLDSVSDEEFDFKFIDLVIPHHEGGIVMAKEALDRAEHGELKALSQQIIDVHQQEIDRLGQYRAAWGGKP